MKNIKESLITFEKHIQSYIKGLNTEDLPFKYLEYTPTRKINHEYEGVFSSWKETDSHEVFIKDGVSAILAKLKARFHEKCETGSLELVNAPIELPAEGLGIISKNIHTTLWDDNEGPSFQIQASYNSQMGHCIALTTYFLVL